MAQCQQRTSIAVPLVHGENGSVNDSDVAPVGIHTGRRVIAREDAVDEVGAYRQHEDQEQQYVCKTNAIVLQVYRAPSDTRHACQLTPTEGLVAIDTGSKINASGGVLKFTGVSSGHQAARATRNTYGYHK